MTALHTHSLGGRNILPPHTLEVLPRVVRHVTGRNAQGKSVFLPTDDHHHHHRDPVNKSAIATINHSTHGHPFTLNGNLDIEHSHENEAPTPLSNESSCQIIDFAPGTTSPMQRLTTHLDHCAVVIEGVFRIILDSGEERTMQRGDMAVHHSTAHRWVNVTGNGSLPARILLVPLHSNDAPPAAAAAEKMWRRLALPRRDSLCVPRSSHRIEDGLDRGRVAKFREDDWWDSEF